MAQCPNCAQRFVKTQLQIIPNIVTGQEFIGCPRYKECGFRGASLEEYGEAKPRSTWTRAWEGQSGPARAPRYPIEGGDLVTLFRQNRDEICRKLRKYFFGDITTGAHSYSGAQFTFLSRGRSCRSKKSDPHPRSMASCYFPLKCEHYLRLLGSWPGLGGTFCWAYALLAGPL